MGHFRNIGGLGGGVSAKLLSNDDGVFYFKYDILGTSAVCVWTGGRHKVGRCALCSLGKQTSQRKIAN
jgi:hypothetical protein